MRLFAALALVLLSPSARAGDCAVGLKPDQLAATLDAAEAAWIGADEASFLLKVEEAILQLPCVDAAIEPALAARYHRDLGLWLYASKQQELASNAFAAAKRIAPKEGLPDELAPTRHPVRRIFNAATPDAAAVAVPLPATGRVLFDGAAGERPSAVNTIFQLEGDQAVSMTRYLRPDTALPAYEELVIAPERGLKGWHLAAGAGVMAVASGGLLLAARSTQDEFLESPPGTPDGLDSLYARNRLFSTSSAVLAGTAGALGFVAVMVW